MSEQGWKKRRALAGMRADEWNSDEKLAVRAERQRMADEAAAANRAAVETADAALADAECRCVACGGTGRLPLTKAAGIVEAMHHYGFQGYQPSKATLAALDCIARGVEVPASLPVISFTYGSISPAPSQAVAPVTPAPMEVVTIAKPLKPTKGNGASFLEDGALIEV